MRVLYWLYKSKAKKSGETPIWVRLTINGEREQFSTGIYVQLSTWNQDKQVVRGRDAHSIAQNQLLTNIKASLIEVYSKLSTTNPKTTAHEVRQTYFSRDSLGKKLIEVFNLHNERIKKLIGKDYSEETYLIYDRTKRTLEDFIWSEYRQKDIYLIKLKRGFLESFIHYLKVIRQLEHNTVYKTVQRLNTIMNFAVNNDYLDKNIFKSPNIRQERKDILYLDTKELETLENKRFHIQRLEVVKDMFLFQCYTGLAYRELKDLTKNNIQVHEDDTLWIVATRQKTGRTFKVPLLPQAERLYLQYRTLSLAPNSPLFPIPSNQKYNAYLKEVADLCGINKELTTHLGRKTFATTVTLLNGVPIETVSALLGHSSIKITQEAYSKVGDAKLSRDMKELRKKFA